MARVFGKNFCPHGTLGYIRATRASGGKPESNQPGSCHPRRPGLESSFFQEAPRTFAWAAKADHTLLVFSDDPDDLRLQRGVVSLNPADEGHLFSSDCVVGVRTPRRKDRQLPGGAKPGSVQVRRTSV